MSSIALVITSLCAVAGPFVILFGAAVVFFTHAGFALRTGSFSHLFHIRMGNDPLVINEAVRIPLLPTGLPAI